MKIFAYNDFILKKFRNKVYGDDSHVLFISYTGKTFFEDYLLGSRLRNSSESGYYEIQNGEKHILALPNYNSVSDFLRSPGIFLQARKILKKRLKEFDVFWLTWPHPISFLILSMIGVRKPVVLFVRQNLEELIKVRYSGINKLAGLYFTRILYRYAKRFHSNALVVSVGEEMFNKMKTDFERSYFISDCIVPQEVSIQPRSAPNDTFKLIFVGRLEPEKGLLVLLEAIIVLRKAGLDLNLTIVGEGQSRRDLEERIEKDLMGDFVKLKGYVPFGQDLFELYTRHDLMVISSFSEGLPKIINEARAFALPIVSTRVGGIAKELKDNETVVFVEPGQSESLANGIKTLLQSPDLYVRLSNNLSEEFKTNSLEYWSGKFAEIVKNYVTNERKS